jgi:hypothetical protein
MGLVHRQGDQGADLQAIFQQLAGAFHPQTLGGQIEKPQPAIQHVLPQGSQVLDGSAAVQAGGGDAALSQLPHLVFHQGHERRDHHRQAPAHQGRQLIAQRLTCPSGKNSQTIAPSEQRLHHRPLPIAESGPPEVMPQGLEEGILHPAHTSTSAFRP